MAAMTLDLAALPARLRARGVRVVETDGWLTLGYDETTFVGQMNHHTALSGPCTPSTAAAMLRGRTDLAGPLCNGHGGLDAQGFIVYMIAGRRARHAGPGSAKVLAEVTRDVAPSDDAIIRGLADDSSVGNRSFFGWEWQHPGDGSPWPPEFLDGIGACNAALADLAGWTANRSIMHREWTHRKIDMSWHGDLRALVARHLEDDMGLTAEDKAWIEQGRKDDREETLKQLLRLARWTSGKTSTVFTAASDSVGVPPPSFSASGPGVTYTGTITNGTVTLAPKA